MCEQRPFYCLWRRLASFPWSGVFFLKDKIPLDHFLSKTFKSSWNRFKTCRFALYSLSPNVNTQNSIPKMMKMFHHRNCTSLSKYVNANLFAILRVKWAIRQKFNFKAPVFKMGIVIDRRHIKPTPKIIPYSQRTLHIICRFFKVNSHVSPKI